MKKRLGLSFLGLAMATAAVVAPNVANAGISECPADHMCMWANNEFSSEIADRAHGDTNIINLPAEANNKMNSWANRSVLHAGCMYGDINGGGDKQTMAKGSSDNNVSPLNSNEVTSWRTSLGC